MTTITIQQIEAVLRDRIMNNGTILVRVPQETLNQMNDVMDHMYTVTEFDSSKLTDEDLDFAMGFAKVFRTASLGNKIVDGRLIVEDQVVVDQALAAITEHFKEAPRGVILPVILVNKIINEERCYAI